MKVHECMSHYLIYGHIDDNIYEVAQKMKKYDIGFLPIMDGKKVVGIITDRDIVVKIIVNHDEKNIKDYLSKGIISIDETDDIEKALDFMCEHKVKRLLVTNNHIITGVLSLSDLIHHSTSIKKILNTVSSIFTINQNKEERKTEIDEFYL